MQRRRRGLTTVLTLAIALALSAAPALATPADRDLDGRSFAVTVTQTNGDMAFENCYSFDDGMFIDPGFPGGGVVVPGTYTQLGGGHAAAYRASAGFTAPFGDVELRQKGVVTPEPAGDGLRIRAWTTVTGIPGLGTLEFVSVGNEVEVCP